jgi:hypothetical protein
VKNRVRGTSASLGGARTTSDGLRNSFLERWHAGTLNSVILSCRDSIVVHAQDAPSGKVDTTRAGTRQASREQFTVQLEIRFALGVPLGSRVLLAYCQAISSDIVITITREGVYPGCSIGGCAISSRGGSNKQQLADGSVRDPPISWEA